jgi:hypothetical protein
MSSVFVTRIISAVSETAIQMSNSSWARPITLPSTWTKVRIGIRVHFTPVVVPGVGSNFVLGLGSGTANIIGDFSTTNFVGVAMGAMTGANAGVFTGMSNSPVTKVGTTYTVGAAIDNANIKFISVNAAATADRGIFYVEITKGSPNYTLDVLMGNSNADVSAALFLSSVQQPTPSGLPSGYGYGTNGAKTIAFSESNGILDTVQCWWNSTLSTPEICDLAVVLLA